MNEQDWLAARFAESRPHLLAVAYRMLGSPSEADDAVQESWLRLSRTGADGIENLGGWLTTVVARVCLDMLRSRARRREEPIDTDRRGEGDGHADHSNRVDPESEALLADAVGPALLVVLDRLTPAERLAFVLHDMFAVSFEEIASIVGRSPGAARQLASRARRRVQGATPGDPGDVARQRAVVEAFLAASRKGDFDALLEVLDPDVIVRADRIAVQAGADREVRGAAAVAGTFAGRARAAQPAMVNGAVGLVWVQHGRPQVVFDITVVGTTIVAIDLVADADSIAALELQVLGG